MAGDLASGRKGFWIALTVSLNVIELALLDSS